MFSFSSSCITGPGHYDNKIMIHAMLRMISNTKDHASTHICHFTDINTHKRSSVQQSKVLKIFETIMCKCGSCWEFYYSCNQMDTKL